MEIEKKFSCESCKYKKSLIKNDQNGGNNIEKNLYLFIKYS